MTKIYADPPLILSAQYGKQEVFHCLAILGADINIRSSKHVTAVQLVSSSGSVDIMKLLLDKLMSANLTDTDEFTLLHFSAQFFLLEETKDFFTKGAALNNAKNIWCHSLDCGCTK